MLVWLTTVSFVPITPSYEGSTGSAGKTSILFLSATNHGMNAAGVPGSAQNLMYLLLEQPRIPTFMNRSLLRLLILPTLSTLRTLLSISELIVFKAIKLSCHAQITVLLLLHFLFNRPHTMDSLWKQLLLIMGRLPLEERIVG